MLDVTGAHLDELLLTGWRSRVARAAAHLRWPEHRSVVRHHRGGTTLAISAPVDQLFLATEVNEWALCAALFDRDPIRWRNLGEELIAAALVADESAAADPGFIEPVIEERAALARFDQLAARESQPRLRTLLDTAAARRLPYVLDDDELTLGAGVGAISYPLDALPAETEVRWDALRGIPTALVTGSNGKTTTVRLLAACMRLQGLKTGFNCTDGVFLDGEALALGDYSGPAGARIVMRDPRTEAAILETARGGILRRGIAVPKAQAAVVTNVSADHFGEYGIDDLAGLADVKLAVAAVVAPLGLLVLNADDAQLRERALQLGRRFGHAVPLGWFAADWNNSFLREQRSKGIPTCGVRDGLLRLSAAGRESELGTIAGMPLTVDGVAAYNIANLCAAALAATSLGVPVAVLRSVFARFGSRAEDNPGRMMRFERDGVKVLIDYAHNPDGLRGFLKVAEHLRAQGGRLGLLLGHAGNRSDADIEELARVAAEFQPSLVVVKETETFLRGREPGEVPRILRAQLLRSGLADYALPVCGSEVQAARWALDWARPGDVLALPLHSAAARAAVIALLENRRLTSS